MKRRYSVADVVGTQWSLAVFAQSIAFEFDIDGVFTEATGRHLIALTGHVSAAITRIHCLVVRKKKLDVTYLCVYNPQPIGQREQKQPVDKRPPMNT